MKLQPFQAILRPLCAEYWRTLRKQGMADKLDKIVARIDRVGVLLTLSLIGIMLLMIQ